MNILLVEDSLADQRLIQEGLKESFEGEYVLHCCKRLDEAIELAHKCPMDCVLLDLQLPDSSGIETVQRFIESTNDLPIIVFTGNNNANQGMLAVRIGAQDYLLKSESNGPILARAIKYAIERHHLREQLKNAAIHDSMTGLLNRRGFLILANKQLKQSKKKNSRCLLLFVDIDQMKMLNDSFGHQFGDSAIIAVSKSLKTTFRTSDLIARIGGDEFIVFAEISGDFDNELLRMRIQENLDTIQTYYQAQLTISCGFIPVPEDTIQLEHLLDEADRKMYQEKRTKKLLM